MQFEEIVEYDRTDDVKTDKEFGSLMLSESSLRALARAGYISPSPVQVQAIPIGLLGFDILVQAKSGTGKTLVFSLLALEGINAQSNVPQVLILTPTREIAIQICTVITRLAPRVVLNIVIGTSGRLCHLVSIRALNTSSIRLFVLDEADKLMDENFQKDINFLFSCLPSEKQVAVFSATYPHNIDSILARYMRNSRLIRAGSADVQLIGIKQFVIIRYAKHANDSLATLLRSITFTQCIIYANDHIRKAFVGFYFDVAFISSAMEQSERNKIMKQLRNFGVKILVSTDLTARGIDVGNVNVIVNMGAPLDCETYLHRIGRAIKFCSLIGGEKFYSRNELLCIRDLHTQRFWQTYARKLFGKLPAEIRIASESYLSFLKVLYSLQNL
ncbi:unnamed protein product [Enterobius vermicularis]|uniref:RNA helicase n=1 Tax=Enterobius vermicularis TaxID=51028 RepID=A0A0N4VDB4_ENTVE|nr:unnamed protein product [Enterobius vermicularis]